MFRRRYKRVAPTLNVHSYMVKTVVAGNGWPCGGGERNRTKEAVAAALRRGGAVTSSYDGPLSPNLSSTPPQLWCRPGFTPL